MRINLSPHHRVQSMIEIITEVTLLHILRTDQAACQTLYHQPFSKQWKEHKKYSYRNLKSSVKRNMHFIFLGSIDSNTRAKTDMQRAITKGLNSVKSSKKIMRKYWRKRSQDNYQPVTASKSHWNWIFVNVRWFFQPRNLISLSQNFLCIPSSQANKMHNDQNMKEVNF